MSSTSASSTTNSKKVLEFAQWNPKAHKYMAPKTNEKGGKSVTLISTQTSRSLHLNTPLLMTWGISDFANDDGTSDGKYKVSLNFPNPEYKTASTDEFLRKMTEFQAQVIDDAVANSELWFGKKKSKELVEDSFFPFLKFPKFKDANGKSTGAIDTSRPPSMSAKVPCYSNPDGTQRWECDLYNIDYNPIFPCDDESITPPDLVPKLSKIACTIQCSGIWVGGKGWGLTWKFISGVVKPKMSETIRGVCHVRVAKDELEQLVNDDTDGLYEESEPVSSDVKSPVKVAEPISTAVDDSDDERETDVPETETERESEPVVMKTPPPPAPAAEPPKVVKKIVKKVVKA